VAAVIVDPDVAGQASTASAPATHASEEPARPIPPTPAIEAAPPPPADEPRAPRSFHFAAGAAVEVARGLGPDTALVPRAFVDFAFPRIAGGVDVHFSGGRGPSRSVATDLGTAKIDLTDLRLDACVDTWSRARLELASCGIVDGVILAGQGMQTDGPRSETRFSVELGLALRTRWIARDWLVLDLVLGASAPLARYRFYFDPDRTAYRLAAVSGFAEFGAGVRFP
jgi:hypothetical protein